MQGVQLSRAAKAARRNPARAANAATADWFFENCGGEHAAAGDRPLPSSMRTSRVFRRPCRRRNSFLCRSQSANCTPMACTSFPVAIGEGSHPFPFRTRKLSLLPPMVLRAKVRGRVGHCREYSQEKPAGSNEPAGFCRQGRSQNTAVFEARCLCIGPFLLFSRVRPSSDRRPWQFRA